MANEFGSPAAPICSATDWARTVQADSTDPSTSPTRTIAAVVVTFNRKALLIECLQALLEQTYPLDRIYVIDQGSTDGTETALGTSGLLKSSKIEYSRSERNTGGAGGFHRGMYAAYTAQFEWIWVMDDDAIAAPDALERMLPLTQTDVVAVANTKIRKDGVIDTSHFRIHHESKAFSGYAPALSFSSFVGLLVARQAIDSIGLPRAEFFLMYDDNEYCRRLRTAGKILLAKDSIILHKEISAAPVCKRRLGRDFPVYSREAFCFRYFLYWRNRVWVQYHSGESFILSSFRLVIPLLKSILAIVLVSSDDVPFRLSILSRAVRDGISGRFDNDFPFRMKAQLAKRAL